MRESLKVQEPREKEIDRERGKRGIERQRDRERRRKIQRSDRGQR